MLEESVLAVAASPLVYVALYLLTTVDGFFPPVPSESVVIALAALAMSTGVPQLAPIIAVAAAGAFTGDQIAYAIGRRVPVRRSRLLRSTRAQRTLDWAEHALTHRGAAFIIGARYIPIGRVAVNMTAGAVGFSRARFVGLTALAAVSWAFYSTAIGIGAGVWLQGRPVVAVAVGVVAGSLIGFGVDAVLSRVQGRPRGPRLGAEPAPGRSAVGVPVDGLADADLGNTLAGEVVTGGGPGPVEPVLDHALHGGPGPRTAGDRPSVGAAACAGGAGAAALLPGPERL